jgi:WD40 repeat protein
MLFVSSGSDGTVKVWNDRGLLRSSEKFTNDITAVAVAREGNFIACGDRAGTCFLIDLTTMKKTGEGYKSTNALKKSKAPWVEAMKVSPTDEYVAWGAHGGLAVVEIGKVIEGNLKKFKAISRGSTSITQLDWSEDGETVSYCAGEPLAVSVSAGKASYPSGCKDSTWATWSQIFGWGVQGIWQGGIDYSNINCTARSHGEQVIATADDFG